MAVSRRIFFIDFKTKKMNLIKEKFMRDTLFWPADARFLQVNGDSFISDSVWQIQLEDAPIFFIEKLQQFDL